MTTTADITPATKIALLKHLASGKSLDIVATIVHLERDQVLDVASHHGYPDRDKLAWAVDVLEKKLDDDATELPDKTAEHTREARATTPRPTVAPAPTPPAGGGALEELITRGKAHESKRIQTAANKVLDDIDRLRTLLREDEKKHAARRKAERERAAARAEVERLERQLAEAKAKLRGDKKPAARSTPTADGPPAATVRAWAAANDVECPSVGRVPAVVRAAYDEAHAHQRAS
ncbi:histone-like nucleoid-structuring protein Lsr2 [Nocardioides sp. SYSU D00065]|uniref:Lsr2 family DNA-binding protein n=1 Tax=Nocardioides sp. SYSU D00065 TaxID=2817378 RepID=UPI001B31B766|nr:histone-like nucleoid-structuring protein Lsr2 [Nocardioides sp. SYSU D00065]